MRINVVSSLNSGLRTFTATNRFSKKTLIEAEAASPEAYVKENGRFPILESTRNESGDVVIVTGDNQGSFVRYTFTE